MLLWVVSGCDQDQPLNEVLRSYAPYPPCLSATEKGERFGMTVFKSLAGPCKTSLQTDQFSPRRRLHHCVWLTKVNTTAARIIAERGVVKNSVTNNHPSLLVAIMAWR